MDLEDVPEDILRNCRLRGFNEDCLIEILKYLDVNDLMTLSRMDSYYKELIHKHVIHKKCIVFDDRTNHNSTREFLVMFGRRIKIFRLISNGWFHRFLLLIIRYCSRGQFVDIEFIFQGERELYDPQIVDVISRFFYNVTSLRFDKSMRNANHTISSLIPQMMKFANRLQSLTLYQVDLDDDHLIEWEQMLHLKVLNLIGVKIGTTRLLDFIRRRPKFEHFMNNRTITGRQIATVGNALVEYCGDNIRSFIDIEGKSYSSDEDSLLRKRYSFIPKLKNLQKVELTSLFLNACDLYYALNGISKHNSLNKLKFTHKGKLIQDTSELKIDEIKSLHTMEISLHTSDGNERNHLRFIKNNIVAIMRNVQTFSLLTNNKYPGYARKMIQAMPKLRKLQLFGGLSVHRIELLELLKAILEYQSENYSTRDRIEVLTILRTEFDDISPVDVIQNVDLRILEHKICEYTLHEHFHALISLR